MNVISVEELKRKLSADEDFFLIDVREVEELNLSRMTGAPYKNFPLSDFNKYIQQIPNNKEVVVFCKAGGRSAMACEILEEHGFENVTNVSGGMMAWTQMQESELK